MIDRATIGKIMDRADIVDVIGDFISLRKAGTSYKGLCPFHDDKTPSFSVSPSKGVYKCFSCGKAGTVVNFVMEHEQMTYTDALRWLARKYHIEVEEKELTEEEKREQNDRESMFIVNEWAAKYFHETLLNNEEGRAIGLQYFRSRGFRDDIIERFRLGYSPNRREAMTTAARTAGYRAEYLVRTGLSYERDNGELTDRYYNRVIFPWISVSGKVTAFGGRLLDSRTKGVAQKYVNSPDSEIYHKNQELYGIYQAKRSIVKEDRVYMVEGYTDVISMHQCGIENVVANSGTALSVHQIKLLRRFTRNITLLYDGDEAGIHAAMRGTDMLLEEGMNVKVLILPDQEDPDSFARKHSSQDFNAYIEAHQTDFMEFKTALMLKGVKDPIKRSEAINSIVKSISVIPDSIVRATYIKDCAQQIGMAEQTLILQMNKYIREQRDKQKKEMERGQAQEESQAPAPQIVTHHREEDKLERMLAEMIVKHGEEVLFRDVESPEDGTITNINVAQYIYYDLATDDLSFHNSLYNTILEEAFAHSKEEDFKAETFFIHHPEVTVNSFASSLLIDRFQLSPSLQVKQEEETLRAKVQHLLLDFRMDYVEEKLKSLRQQLKSCTGDVEKVMKLMAEIKKNQDMRNIIAKKLGTNIIA